MSQANNPITLKIHHGVDIRRFHLEKLDWEELTKLISSTYPSPYTLKYRDTDNDLVTMVAQQDLQDAYDMSQGDVLHLHVMDQTPNPKYDLPPSTASSPAGVDMKSSKEDDLASQLSHDEISTLLSECLSDPTIVNAIPPFLTTFIDQLTVNLSNVNPLSTSWTQTLQQHPIIRDHVILFVLLPRMEQALTRADTNNVATRIPTHVLPMVKGFLPMLPMFLPTLVPMFTKFMSDATTTTTDAQQGQGNPFANSPLASMLGPMLSGMQQPVTQASSPSSSSSATSPSNSNPAAPFNPLSVLGPLLAGASANPGASSTSASPSNTAPQVQPNPLLGLLGPLLAANNANTGNQANINPLASLLQQYAQAPHDNATTTANTNSNNNHPADYTEQLAQLDSMGVGNHELNLVLLRQCDGSVERVVQLLAQD